MITLYRLKSNKCFRKIYKRPYYVKYLCLIMAQVIALTVIYWCFFYGKTYPWTIHVTPHSHDDVGWLKTLDQYFYGSRKDI